MNENLYNNIEEEKRQELAQIIEAVALEQAAISSILNTQCENIQKLLETYSSTAEQITKLNKLNFSTVYTITKTESILYAKLASFENRLYTKS